MPPFSDSTDGYAQSRFPMHGRVWVQTEGPLLLNVADGPFNRELVLALGSLLATRIPEMQAQGPWVLLAVIRHSTLATDEALAAFTDMLLHIAAAGRAPRAVAHVTASDVEGVGLMDVPMARCFEAAGIPFACFRDELPARAWLAGRLAG
ncbi:hypothetical protein QRD43_16010 [Pelomonas sp. APW6]|uniref:STAS/SEC14 domain-containing protein n=1 Tax=Roseateles subflavus TaxID=3053353 RepID=A0ABT7LNY0_9BURK|nr:hypothetical protein [Pelomonas sp. APW6]MDL5033420.1 hypothetical protein [Pelomonas sp. APW6]